MVSVLSFEEKEKNRVALISVISAIFLMTFKLVVGIATNSLGILSEAVHSGLDLVAAIITFFAVKYSSRPADKEHHFGHGKIENISALFETLLLLITCIWIIYEVFERLMGKHFQIEVNIFSFAVIFISIIIDYSRSSQLKKIANKYNSQALEADALHFSTDIFSSFVVLIGLVGVLLNYNYADSISALIVALIVIVISFRLGKKSIDVLLDKAPKGIEEKINKIISEIPQVLKAHDIKIRNSGAFSLIEMNIHVKPDLSVEEAHNISHIVEKKILSQIEKSEVHIHIEPEK